MRFDSLFAVCLFNYTVEFEFQNLSAVPSIKFYFTLYADAVKEIYHRSDEFCTLWSLDLFIASG
jgi:hypothetical protein